MSYSEIDYRLMVKRLSQYSDSKYGQFQSGLAMGNSFMYGVRVPKLREICKHIVSGDWRGFLGVAQDNSYEEIMLQGMVISQAKCPIEETFEYAGEFVKKIDNWAICDTFCGDFKAARKNRPSTLDFIMKYADSDREFERRFVIVMLMDYYLIDEYVDEALETIVSIEKKEYYVMMAAAWALATAFTKYREKVLDILTGHKLDPVTHNKVIRKCRESYRVSDEDKALLKELKVKNVK